MMRIKVIAACMLLGGFTQGQSILPIYYYIAPTIGCNGVVALGLPDWNGCIGGGGAMMVYPMGCMGSTWASGDTAFIGICSDPCQIVIMDDFGNACMCSVGFPTAVLELSGAPRCRFSRSADNLVIVSPIALINATCRIYNISGRLILEQALSFGSKWELPMPSTYELLIVMVVSNGRTWIGRV